MTDMHELGPEARALLDAARAGLSPDPAAVQRIHARIHAATAGAVAGTALGVKLGLLGLVAAIAIGGGVYSTRSPGSPTPAPAPDLALASPAEQRQRAAAREAQVSDDDLIAIETPLVGGSHSGEPRDVPMQPAPRVDSRTASAASPAGGSPRAAATAPAAASTWPTPIARTASATRVAPSPLPGATAPPAHAGAARGSGASLETRRAGIELGREVELIDAAMAALRRGDAAGALRVMQEYAAEAGDAGQLRQDAAAIEIEALCKLRDPAVRDKRAAFDARFLHSAQRARLEAACR
jgi:hypothetical protein